MVENFGGNLSFQPAHLYSPRTEQEVLDILARHRGSRIKAIGRLHSWSEAARGDEVLIDLRHFNQVQTEQRPEGVWAVVGAGCQVKRVLTELERQAGVTLPSLGLITEQAIAGAISTGTHGSGRHSMSHYMSEVRIAYYDPATGEPVIRTITEGPELQAARCSLGCLGVILSVGFWTRPKYNIEEWISRYPTLDEALASEGDSPLQQFYLIPWAWNYLVQHRKAVDSPRCSMAWLYRIYCFLTFDLGVHIALLFLERILQSSRAIKFFHRRLLHLAVVQGRHVVDNSSDMLVMEQELFRHIEIEMFVRRSALPQALSFVRELLSHFGGDKDALSETTRTQLAEHDLLAAVEAGAGRFTYNFLVCVRKVLADDTLISMASSDEEPCYALSFVSLAKTTKRAGFYQFAQCLSDCMVTLFSARPHWGKYNPLTAQQVAAIYPRLPEFQTLCEQLDPNQVFRNDWINRVLFHEPEASAKRNGHSSL
ncbi:MAG: D-arabinono-1,4-lactone oxidase [Planctomycetaceae bacterium]